MLTIKKRFLIPFKVVEFLRRRWLGRFNGLGDGQRGKGERKLYREVAGDIGAAGND